LPYASLAQARFFHSAGAKAAGISDKTVQEFDSASKGKELPDKITKDYATMRKGK
jgi:hypothetical protein